MRKTLKNAIARVYLKVELLVKFTGAQWMSELNLLEDTSIVCTPASTTFLRELSIFHACCAILIVRYY